jgi:hypothetical protein
MRTRPTHLFSFAVLALAAILLTSGTPRQSYAQKFGPKFGGGKGRGRPDPAQMFDFMSKGLGYITIASQDFGRDKMEEFAKKEGITSGRLNRDQFIKYFEEQMQNWRNKGRGPGGKGGPGGRGPDPEFIIRRYDTNGDGKLNETEIAAMSDKFQDFKTDWKKYDTNKDSLISADEYKVYMDARMKAREEQRKDGDRKDEPRKDGDKKDGDKKDGDKKDGDKKAEEKPLLRIEIDDIEDTKPTVYYARNLPKELPDWFNDLDANKDGQVSLMEWVKGGKSIRDFAKIDRNDDGLLTPDEVLRYQRLLTGDTAVVANGGGAPEANGQRPFGKGGQRPFGKGPKGRDFKGFKGKRMDRAGQN